MGETPVTWRRSGADGNARTGAMETPHGTVPTPNFMAVGTRATVRTLDSADLLALGADIVLANTYHLMLRPGDGIVEQLGGLHSFMAWDRPILTDSGGYQILSLGPNVTEDAVEFRSTYDGSAVRLDPERSIEVQEALGSDIAMVLDVPVALPSDRRTTVAALERTLRWAERSLAAKRRPDRALFGIVQGGADAELRRRSARATASLGFPGFGIGGLAVGESPAERAVAIGAVVPELPERAVRYVMGLGDTEGLLDAIGLGVDLFDCVIPTRLARHGKAHTRSGDVSVKQRTWNDDARPLDEACTCAVCATYSRAYLRHLHRTKELTGLRLLTIHNLHYLYALMADARDHIAAGTFEAWSEDVRGRRRTGGSDTGT